MTEIIDPTSDSPLYLKIAERLRAAIENGELPAGSKLPSESELIETYGAARGTVRHAIATLRNEGLLDVQHGRGVFVPRRPPMQRKAYDRFARSHRKEGRAAYLAEMEQAGRRPEVEVLEVGPALASPEITSRLRLEEGARVLVRRRRYLADGEPTELATSYLPWDLVKDSPMVQPNPGPGGIYARLEDIGHTLEHFTEEVRARMPRPEESRALHIPPGVPVFVLVRTAYDMAGTPVEVCDTTMRADAWNLYYELPAH